ncbi:MULTISPECIES: ester cyclase [unclassified Duganella]|uniref:nuclear transport factor 2 family protein n=1 Tax=unclassified Duganella TaxID=2636909 RepID=UPI000B895314|nr:MULTISPECIES: nuclear transport factor 2 family protein [unclassified Duganella]
MKLWLHGLALVCAVTLHWPVAGAADATTAHLTATNRVTMISFVRTLYEEGKVRAAYERYVALDLIQHNPNIADGREPAIVELEGLLRDPNAKFEVRRVVVDGDIAVVHFKGTLSKNGPSAAVIEVFRLENGKIVEHWDVFQVMGGASKSPHPYF